MNTLDRKLLRNLLSMKGQLVAIILIMACGVGIFLSTLMAYRGLKTSRDTYYRRSRMADLFAPLKRAPRSVVHDLEHVAGVRRVEGRIVFDVTLDLSAMPQPASGRAISVPDRRRGIINDLHLTGGHWFEGDGTREVILADSFAKVHALVVGDTIQVVMNNRKEQLTIIGTALSPEFVYLIRGASDVMPDAEHFTVFWISETFAESAFDFKDACNDVVALLDPGARPEDVIASFDRELDRYGAAGAYGRKDQLSNRFLTDEIKGLRGSATMVPAIFLGVAAFVLNMLMGRLVRTQRTQIAVLRAFGYRRLQVVVHFLKLAFIVAAFGSMAGILLGRQIANWSLDLYRQFYALPVLEFRLEPALIVTAVLVSGACALLGAQAAARRAAELVPAEGMRPEAPRSYGIIWLERVQIVWKHLGFATRMVARNISRTKMRAGVTIGAVAMATSILLLAFFTADTMDAIIDINFRLQERQDARIAFHTERGRSALHEIRHLEGVRTAEAEYMVGVKLVNGWRSRRIGITGLAPDQTLHGLLDTDLQHIRIPEEGLSLSRKLAELLNVGPGDPIEIHVLTGRKNKFTVSVEKVVEDYLGMAAYARLDRLARWMGEGEVLTGAVMDIDSIRSTEVKKALKDIPSIASVSFKSDTLRSFEETIAASQGVMTGTLILFAGIITFGVVYNAARISLAERQRELGSMRVMGFTNREVGAVLMGENIFLACVAVAPGLALGALFSWLLSSLYDTDLYRFPFVLSGKSMFITAMTVLGFAVLANLAVRRRLHSLDLVEVLKARE